MLQQRGFRWALLASIALHVVAFFTIPLGGKVGEAREKVVRQFSETTIKFVRIIKPEPVPEVKPKPPPRRIVPRDVRRWRPRARPRRRVTPPAEDTAPSETPETDEPVAPSELVVEPPPPVEETPEPPPAPGPTVPEPQPEAVVIAPSDLGDLGPIVEAGGEATNRAGLYEPEDTVVASLRFETGALASCSWCYVGEVQNRVDRMELYGTLGRISFSISTLHPIELLCGGKRQTWSFQKPQPVQLLLISDIVKALQRRKDFPSNANSASRTAWAMDRILGRL